MTTAVRGQVRHADGRAVVGATLRAFDRDLRGEELLGEAKPDAGGRYEITYSRDRFTRAEKENADLVLRVLGPDGRELAVWEVQFNAPEEVNLDITVPAGTWELSSLFETLRMALEPLLVHVALASTSSGSTSDGCGNVERTSTTSTPHPPAPRYRKPGTGCGRKPTDQPATETWTS